MNLLPAALLGAALLSDARVGGTVDQGFAGELEHRLLERPDEVELCQHRAEQGGVGRFPVGGGGRELDPLHTRIQTTLFRHVGTVPQD